LHPKKKEMISQSFEIYYLLPGRIIVSAGAGACFYRNMKNALSQYLNFGITIDIEINRGSCTELIV
jgi:hypothetical protein